MTTKKLGRGLGLATLVLALVAVPALSAYGDSSDNCYTLCTPTTTQATGGGGGSSTSGGGGNNSTGNSGGTHGPVTKSSGGSGSSGSAGSGATTTAVSTKSAGGSLPFTGADIEQMSIGGLGALLLGGVLLRRSRNRRRASV